MRDCERLVFGTAALGLPYGLPRDDGARPPLMSNGTAEMLVRLAITKGIHTFDTAPAYGVAEDRLGDALRNQPARIWTKTAHPLDVMLDTSLRRLRRERLDLLQWHNWTSDTFVPEDVARWWGDLRVDGRVRAVGASTYGIPNARAAIRSGLFDVVQIEWSILNQGVLRSVGVEAKDRGVKLALRSVYLQGALTDEGRKLPPLDVLRRGVVQARERAHALGVSLEHLALRAALDRDVNWVLLGFDDAMHIETAVKIAESPSIAKEVDDLDLHPDPAVDPRTWPQST